MLGIKLITEGDQKSLFGRDIRMKTKYQEKRGHEKGLGKEYSRQKTEQIQRPKRAVP